MGLVAALEWLGRPYRLTRVDMLGEMQQVAYRRINARHETPAFISDDGRLLTETMAIAAWVEARDTKRRVSFDPLTAEADRMRQLMAFINTGFTSAFSPLWAAYEGEMPEAEKAVLRAFGGDQVRRRHDQLEQLLGDTPYAVADRPTLADGVFIGVARWLDFHQLGEPGRWPRIARLRERLEADDAVRFAAKIEAGEEPDSSVAFRGHVPLAELISAHGAAV